MSQVGQTGLALLGLAVLTLVPLTRAVTPSPTDAACKRQHPVVVAERVGNGQVARFRDDSLVVAQCREASPMGTKTITMQISDMDAKETAAGRPISSPSSTPDRPSS
jgi:hypothetical protein